MIGSVECCRQCGGGEFDSYAGTELINKQACYTRWEWRQAIFNYVEVWYNRGCRRLIAGYLSLADY